MSRRTWMAGAAVAGLPGWAEASARLDRTDLGQGMLWLAEMRPGDPCTVSSKMVRWRGHLLGFLPAELGDLPDCRIASAGLDADGCSDIRVRV
ncbi:MAG: hypothetical protein ABW023_01725 [Sphingomonas sp.]